MYFKITSLKLFSVLKISFLFFIDASKLFILSQTRGKSSRTFKPPVPSDLELFQVCTRQALQMGDCDSSASGRVCRRVHTVVCTADVNLALDRQRREGRNECV